MLKKILATAVAAVALGMIGTSDVAHASNVEENKVADSQEVTSTPRAIAIPYENNFKAPTQFGVKGIFDKDYPMSVQVRFFAPHLDAEVHTDKTSFRGGDLSLKDTLGFGNDNAPELIFKYNRFKLDYFHVHGTGDTHIDADDLTDGLRVDNRDFSGDVHSQSDFHYLKLDITNPVVTEENYGVEWMYGLTGMYWKGEVTGQVEDTLGLGLRHKDSASEDFAVPVPTLGLGAYAYVMPELKVYAQLEGLPLGGYGHFYDLEAGVHYKPIDHFGINVGYRKINVKVKHDDDNGKLKLGGVFAGLSYDF